MLEIENKVLFDVQFDEEQFSKMYDQFSPALLYLIMKSVRNKALSKKILKEVFITAWNSRESYDGNKQRVFTWLYKINRKAIINNLNNQNFKARV